MRTTVSIDDELLQQTKLLAVQSNRTVSSVMEDALRRLINAHAQRPVERTFVLPSHGSGGLLPGVDLNDMHALLDLMDE